MSMYTTGSQSKNLQNPMPLEWWPSGAPKPSIYTLPQEIVDQILEYLYLKIAKTSLTIGYAEEKFDHWQYYIVPHTFESEEILKWSRPWYDFGSVWFWYVKRTHITSAFSLLPQEIIDEIAQHHFVSLLNGSLYTGGAYTKIKEWRNAVPIQAFGPIEGIKWLKDLSYYPILTAAFNKIARREYIQYD